MMTSDAARSNLSYNSLNEESRMSPTESGKTLLPFNINDQPIYTQKRLLPLNVKVLPSTSIKNPSIPLNVKILPMDKREVLTPLDSKKLPIRKNEKLLSKSLKNLRRPKKFYAKLQNIDNSFLKLNYDCFEIIFNKASIRSIMKMGKTCERMQDVAGQFIQAFVLPFQYKPINNLIYYESIYIRKSFYKFINIIKYKLDGDNNLKKIVDLLHSKLCPNLDHLILQSIKNVSEYIIFDENFCKNIDTITIKNANNVDLSKFLNNLLLTVRKFSISISSYNSYRLIFDLRFKRLENFTLDFCYSYANNEQKTYILEFFQFHTSLKYFKCDSFFLEKFIDVFTNNTNVFNLLEFTVDLSIHHTDEIFFFEKKLIFLLQSLYDRGCYKFLNLHIFSYVSIKNRSYISNVFENLTNEPFSVPIKSIKFSEEILENHLLLNFSQKFNKTLDTIKTYYSKHNIIPFIMNSTHLKVIILHQRDRHKHDQILNLPSLDKLCENVRIKHPLTIKCHEIDYLDFVKLFNLSELTCLKIVRYTVCL